MNQLTLEYFDFECLYPLVYSSIIVTVDLLRHKRSQWDSSLWIHCTRTNGKSTVLFGSADKVTGICSGEQTRNLAW